MIGYLNLILRLVIWFLLTADLSLPNILMGVTIALILPHKHREPGALKDWWRALWRLVLANPLLPQNHREAGALKDWLRALLRLVLAIPLLPQNPRVTGTLEDWLRALWELVEAIPIAYKEAFEMIFNPHDEEDVVMERVPPRRSEGLIFLDIFLITFTPKTIVLKYRDRGQYELEFGSNTPENIVLKHRELGWYEVHRVGRGKKG